AAGIASADSTHIRWNACLGDGGVDNRFFACDVNTGTDQIVFTFTLTGQVTGVYQTDAALLISFPGTTLPEWWQFVTPGSGRVTSLAAVTLPPPGASACIDWAALDRDVLLSYVPPQFGSQNTFLLRVLTPTTPTLAADLVGGQEYFVFR